LTAGPGFFSGFIEIRRKINGIFINIGKESPLQGLQVLPRVPIGGGRVAIHGTVVALTVNQR
jgi:hypothetical protein